MSTTTGLKSRLQSDLTMSMKARDAVRSSTIRMALTAIRSDEVAGTTARELSEAEVTAVLGREAKKRREAATAYDDAGRAELEILAGYLPRQLSDDQIKAIVAEEVAAVASSGVTGRAAMGAVMKAVKPRVEGQAEGGRVAAEVRGQLGM